MAYMTIRNGFSHTVLCLAGVGCLLAACGSPSLDKGGETAAQTGFIQGVRGALVADEPTAALVGREILRGGGTAGDAAAAMFFVMSVTQPTHVGFGGGGLCTVRYQKENRTETIDFLNRLPVDANGTPSGTAPVPGGLRGVAFIHAKMGNLPWSQVIGPAERLARFGAAVPRGLASDLRRNRNLFTGSRALRSLFGEKGGGPPVKEGAKIFNRALSDTMTVLRRRGVKAFYNGSLTDTYIHAANADGGRLSKAAMRDFRPFKRPTLDIPWQALTNFSFPSPPGSGGLLAAQMTALLVNSDLYESIDAGDRPHVLVEAGLTAYAERQRWRTAADGSAGDAGPFINEDWAEDRIGKASLEKARNAAAFSPRPVPLKVNDATASFSVIDRKGNAAACSFTMDGPYGSARLVEKLGILLPAKPGANGAPAGGMAPYLLTSAGDSRVYFAGHVSGGEGAPLDLVSASLEILGVGTPLDAAINGPRFRPALEPDVVVYEPRLTPEIRAELEERGHILAERSDGWSRVGVIFCANGIPVDEKLAKGCLPLADRRGFGLGVTND